MLDENARTLITYENAIQAYIDGTPQTPKGDWQVFLDDALYGLNSDAAIFEIGSGSGRDAAYMIEKGYSPICSDAAKAFVHHLNAIGLKVTYYNLLTDGFEGIYDLVFAHAVLFHFKRADVPAMIEKIYNALAKNGRFAFSLKAGDGEEWLLEKMNAPRFFCYWQETDIKKILRSAGFVKIDIKTIASKTRQVQWLQIIAHK